MQLKEEEKSCKRAFHEALRNIDGYCLNDIEIACFFSNFEETLHLWNVMYRF